MCAPQPHILSPQTHSLEVSVVVLSSHDPSGSESHNAHGAQIVASSLVRCSVPFPSSCPQVRAITPYAPC